MPVGTIVMGAKPALGVWERIQGKFILGSSSAHPAGSTGGAETHKLTVNEMPSHGHPLSSPTMALGTGNSGFTDTGGSIGWRDNIVAQAGGGQAHNNMPPFLAADIWRRTA